jgi:hypothetical protein
MRSLAALLKFLYPWAIAQAMDQKKKQAASNGWIDGGAL